MQAAISNRLGLHLQTLASQPLHQGPAATVLLLDTLHQAVGQVGAAPSLASVYSEVLAGALAQLGAAAGASLAALPVLDLTDANSNALDGQLLNLLGQVVTGALCCAVCCIMAMLWHMQLCLPAYQLCQSATCCRSSGRQIDGPCCKFCICYLSTQTRL